VQHSQYGLVFAGGRRAQGRVVAVGGLKYRVGSERIEAGQVDSFFVRRQELSWRPVAAGAGIGALLGVFVSGVVYPALGADVAPSAGSWPAGGALAGGVLGLILSGRGSNGVWDRRWPVEAAER